MFDAVVDARKQCRETVGAEVCISSKATKRSLRQPIRLSTLLCKRSSYTEARSCHSPRPYITIKDFFGFTFAHFEGSPCHKMNTPFRPPRLNLGNDNTQLLDTEPVEEYMDTSFETGGKKRRQPCVRHDIIGESATSCHFLRFG